jgi:hypothetical protein
MMNAPRAKRLPLVVSAILALLLVPVAASADGGAVLLQETSGPFVITVFTGPPPLRIGVVDVSVLVQDRAEGSPILDADVTIQLSPPAASNGSEAPITVAATHAQATNKLFYAALVELAVPGIWKLRVDVRQGNAAANLGAPLPIASSLPTLYAIWPYLVLPPAALALFALHQWLVRQRLGPQ